MNKQDIVLSVFSCVFWFFIFSWVVNLFYKQRKNKTPIEEAIKQSALIIVVSLVLGIALFFVGILFCLGGLIIFSPLRALAPFL